MNSLHPGQTILHYRIVDKIGQGGMGEVYLAEDTKLDRKVAIKFLPPESTADEQARKRLVREARAAAKLDHPNICSIYEVGEEDGRSFIVMQFVEGETLAVRLKRQPLELRQVLSVAVQVADGLAEAHSRGIIHRDIKPANIMLTARHQAKVMDFGLAIAVRERSLTDTTAETESLLTEPGAIVGTVPYMSPEQVRGESLDARSDIFSFGAVLYEMITGHQPFAAESAAMTISAIVTTEPAPLARYSKAVPRQLERIVNKALRKDREERYQTARDLLIDLKSLKHELEFEAELERSKSPDTSVTSEKQAVTDANQLTDTGGPTSRAASTGAHVLSGIKRHKRGALLALAALVAVTAAVAYFGYSQYAGGSGAGTIRSLAVLPFTNADGNPDAEYLSDGISESLINSLSQLPGVKVIARSSSFRYKGKEVDPQEVANALGVEAILTGRVVQRGDNLLISAELVNASDKTHVWGEQYNRKLADLLTVQEEIAKRISEKLRLRLSGEEQQRLTKRYSDNVEAYQAYLKGRFYSAKSTESGLKKSIEYFNQAIEIDPNYALAWAGLANGYWEDSDIHIAPHDAMPKATQAALKALAIDDTLAEAHAALAVALTAYDWDWPKAEKEFRRAIELNPDYPSAHAQYGWYLSLMARPEEAIAELKRATQLDPLSTQDHAYLGLALHWARRYDEAIAQLQKTLEMYPSGWFARTCLGWVLISQGKFSEAITELQRTRQIDDNQYVLGALGQAYALSGNRSEALKAIEQMKEWSKQRYVSPHSVAMIYAGLGEKDLAFEWLEKAFEARSEHLGWLKVDPRVDPLRTDPRFAALMRRVGLAPKAP